MMYRFRYLSARVIATGFLLLALDLLALDGAILAEDASNSQAIKYSAPEGVSTLGGKRLFFDQSERLAITTNDVRPAETSHVVSEASVFPEDAPISGTSGVTTHSLAESAGAITQPTVEPELSTVPIGRIHYQARIRSSSAIRVIINGLPCERINRVLRQPASSETALSCSALDAHLYQLRLLADDESVQVRSGVRVLGTLIPGDKL